MTRTPGALVGTGILVSSLLAPPGLFASGPRPVSPGRSSSRPSIAQSCPSFSFSASPDAASHELAVLRLAPDQGADDLEHSSVALRVEIPAGATSWSPSLDECLEAGADYAWVIRARTEVGAGEWSEPAWFSVPLAPSTQELESALRILERYEEAARRSADGAPRSEDRGHATPRERARQRARQEAESRIPTALAATPDSVGLNASLAATSGINFAVRGLAASDTAGAAGVVGIASGTAGDNAGLIGQTDSAAGVAAQLDNTAGGDILRGLVNGVEMFSVDGAGLVTADAFAGDGSMLTGIALDDGMVAGGTGGVIVDGSITGADVLDGSLTGDDILDGAITGADIASNAINSARIQDGAITGADIASNAIDSARIQDGTITGADIANNAIDSARIQDGAITGADIASSAINSAKIQDGTITGADIASSAIDSTKIQNGTITAADIAIGSIDSARIDDGTITGTDVASNSIPGTDIVDGTITGSDHSGDFCVVRKGATACPSGFSTLVPITWDTENTGNLDTCDTDVATSCAFPGIRLTFCCK